MHELSRDGSVEVLGEGSFVTVMGPESRMEVWVRVAGESLFAYLGGSIANLPNKNTGCLPSH